jgi:hypothetical protein
MKRLSGAWAVLLLAAGSARGGTSAWDWSASDHETHAMIYSTGMQRSVRAEYNPAHNTFAWVTAFSDRMTTRLVPAGHRAPFSVRAVSVFAIDAFDAASHLGGGQDGTRGGTTRFSGLNSSNGFNDTGRGVGGREADTLRTVPRMLDLIFETTLGDDQANRPGFSLGLGDGMIDAHDSPYANGTDWSRLGFGDSVWLWTRRYPLLSAGSRANGSLTPWSVLAGEPGFDGRGLVTAPIPAAVVMGVMGLGFMLARRHWRGDGAGTP